jgi:predicted amidohydrolase
MVVDPWGTLLAVAPERQTFVLAELDANAQDQMRREIPSLGHRRM